MTPSLAPFPSKTPEREVLRVSGKEGSCTKTATIWLGMGWGALPGPSRVFLASLNP